MKKYTTLLSAALLAVAPAVFADTTTTTNTTDNTKTTDNAKQMFTDSAITAKVKEKFIAEKLFGDKKIDAMTIHVNTKQGVVYLTGKADSQARVTTAVDLAKKVEGVKEVVEKVKIEN